MNTLVLHPRHKLSYFAKAGWEDEWVDTARDIVQAEFDRSYAKPQEEQDDNEISHTFAQTVRGILFLICILFLNGFHTGIPQHLRQSAQSRQAQVIGASGRTRPLPQHRPGTGRQRAHVVE